MLVGSLVVAAAGCGPQARKPGPNAGEFAFWRVTSSNVDFGECSDEPGLRESLGPIDAGTDRYFLYRVAPDGATARAQDCTHLSRSTCHDLDGGAVFTIAGNELTFTDESTAPITNTTCTLKVLETWTLTDQGEQCLVDVKDLLSLVGPQAECQRVEADLLRRSPNMKGVTGCVVTYTLSGAWTPVP